MKKLNIRLLTHEDMPAWDSYVDTHPDGTFFHLSGWHTVVQTVFNHKPHYLLAESDAGICGVLPLVQQRSRIFGHSLISTPFCVYGGVVADNEEVRQQLEAASLALGHKLRVDYVEIRDKEPKPSNDQWVEHCHHATFSSDIPENRDDILTSVKRKQRAVIRHSLKNDLTWTTQDSVSQCYDVYAESVRNLGTPVFNKRLFTELKKVFGRQCEALVVKDSQGVAVSGVLSFFYKDTVLPYYGGGTDQARALKSNDFMYYQLMCHANEKGFRKFDFGRSKIDSGSYSYKKNWGMTEEKLHYRIALINAKGLPNLSPNNPKYRAFIGLWKKMPLSLTRHFGPQLSKYLG